MTDPLIGSIHNTTGVLRITDLPASPATEPRVALSLADQSMEMSLADINKALFTLKQAQELLTERRGNAFLRNNLELF